MMGGRMYGPYVVNIRTSLYNYIFSVNLKKGKQQILGCI